MTNVYRYIHFLRLGCDLSTNVVQGRHSFIYFFMFVSTIFGRFEANPQTLVPAKIVTLRYIIILSGYIYILLYRGFERTVPPPSACVYLVIPVFISLDKTDIANILFSTYIYIYS